jgi:glycosyltransferase involved in cell wall biosynthesis
MPVLNEAQHLVSAVESVFKQALPAGMGAELVLALGPSTDATNQIANELKVKYPTLTLVENPKGLTSAGLNAAIASTSGSIVVRVDAHSKLTPGYVLTAIEILDSNSLIGNVGGQMLAQGETEFESAVAWAYRSRYGLGGGKFHVGGDQGAVDTVYLGVFRKEALVKAGFFDESVVRGQDWELNQRIRAQGYLIWFDPRLKVIYRPRSSWTSLLTQFYKTGLSRGKLSRETFPNISFRYLAPPTLVLLTLLWVPAWVYLLLVAAIAITAKDLKTDSKYWLLIVLPTMHYSWGVGFILGILFPSLAKAGDE